MDGLSMHPIASGDQLIVTLDRYPWLSIRDCLRTSLDVCRRFRRMLLMVVSALAMRLSMRLLANTDSQVGMASEDLWSTGADWMTMEACTSLLGNAIRRRRRELSYERHRVAFAIGRTREWLVELENGNLPQDQITDEILIALARELQISVLPLRILANLPDPKFWERDMEVKEYQ